MFKVIIPTNNFEYNWSDVGAVRDDRYWRNNFLKRKIEGYKHADRWKTLIEFKSTKGKCKREANNATTKQLKTLNSANFEKDYRVSPILIEPEVIGNSDLQGSEKDIQSIIAYGGSDVVTSVDRRPNYMNDKCVYVVTAIIQLINGSFIDTKRT